MLLTAQRMAKETHRKCLMMQQAEAARLDAAQAPAARRLAIQLGLWRRRGRAVAASQIGTAGLPAAHADWRAGTGECAQRWQWRDKRSSNGGSSGSSGGGMAADALASPSYFPFPFTPVGQPTLTKTSARCDLTTRRAGYNGTAVLSQVV